MQINLNQKIDYLNPSLHVNWDWFGKQTFALRTQVWSQVDCWSLQTATIAFSSMLRFNLDFREWTLIGCQDQASSEILRKVQIFQLEGTVRACRITKSEWTSFSCRAIHTLVFPAENVPLLASLHWLCMDSLCTCFWCEPTFRPTVSSMEGGAGWGGTAALCVVLQY